MGWLHAKGTLAGTAVANQAQIAYVVGAATGAVSSNEDTFVVDRIVDVQTAWQDAAPVKVAAGDQGRVLTFLVTNEGNGDDNLTLSYDHNTSSDFIPTGVTLYEDTNGNGRYDPGVDANVTGLSLAADANATIFLVGTIPDDNSTVSGNTSHEILQAATESNASAGADHPGAIDVVIRTGEDNATGIYEIREYWLESRKTATVHSDDNATHTGTRVTYTITVWIGGRAAHHTIAGVHVHDAIPPGTQYVAGSLRLGTAVLSDAADGDRGAYAAAAIDVNVGTLHGATPQKVQFDVRIR